MKDIKVYHDCSIEVYRLFTTIFNKCLILLLIFIVHFPIMLGLCLMLSMTYCAQNYAGIIGGSLDIEPFIITEPMYTGLWQIMMHGKLSLMTTSFQSC